jgi:hypothetical protein
MTIASIVEALELRFSIASRDWSGRLSPSGRGRYTAHVA